VPHHLHHLSTAVELIVVIAIAWDNVLAIFLIIILVFLVIVVIDLYRLLVHGVVLIGQGQLVRFFAVLLQLIDLGYVILVRVLFLLIILLLRVVIDELLLVDRLFDFFLLLVW
jgi:hypothetical protein